MYFFYTGRKAGTWRLSKSVLYAPFVDDNQEMVWTRHVKINICTGVLISPWPDLEGSKLQRPNSTFCKPLKNNSEGFPSNQVSAAAMTSASDKNGDLSIVFFSRVELKTYQHPCMIIHVRKGYVWNVPFVETWIVAMMRWFWLSVIIWAWKNNTI